MALIGAFTASLCFILFGLVIFISSTAWFFTLYRKLKQPTWTTHNGVAYQTIRIQNFNEITTRVHLLNSFAILFIIIGILLLWIATWDSRTVTIPPCWDVNRNQRCDPGEDWNEDGHCSAADCNPNNMVNLYIAGQIITRDLSVDNVTTNVVRSENMVATKTITTKVLDTKTINNATAFFNEVGSWSGGGYTIQDMYVVQDAGIGCPSDPSYTLKVCGNSLITKNLTVNQRVTTHTLQTSGSAGIGGPPDSPSSCMLKVYGNICEVWNLTVQASIQTQLLQVDGLVGIGTSPSQTYPLNVGGNSHFIKNLTVDHQINTRDLHVTGLVGIGTTPNQAYPLNVGENCYFTKNLTVGKQINAHDLQVDGLVGIGTSPDQSFRLKVAGNMYSTGTLTASNIAAGSYTPIYTEVSNIDSITHKAAYYMRYGNIVEVRIQVDVDVTGTTLSFAFTQTLPISTDLVNPTDVIGQGLVISSTQWLIYIDADTTANEASIHALGLNLLSSVLTLYYSFTYVLTS